MACRSGALPFDYGEAPTGWSFALRYLCLVYRDADAWQALSPAARSRLDAEQRDCLAELNEHGRLVTAASLDPPHTTVGRRLPCAVIDIEARDLNAAIQFAARLPLARVGDVEVRPVHFADDRESATISPDTPTRSHR